MQVELTHSQLELLLSLLRDYREEIRKSLKLKQFDKKLSNELVHYLHQEQDSVRDLMSTLAEAKKV